jgi:hypothetical protein
MGNLVTSDGNRVNVGNCDASGVNVNNNWDDNRNDNIGVGASRNFPRYLTKPTPFCSRRLV